MLTKTGHHHKGIHTDDEMEKWTTTALFWSLPRPTLLISADGGLD